MDTQNFERKLSKFTGEVSINVHPLTSPLCLSTKIEYLHCNLGGCLVSSIGIATRDPLDGLGVEFRRGRHFLLQSGETQAPT